LNYGAFFVALFVDNNQRGTFSEYLFCTECLKKGYNVSMPLMDSSIYDCLVDTGKEIYKIQIKSSIKTPIKKNHNTIHVPLQNNKKKYTKTKIDFFAVYVDFFGGFFVFKNLGNMQSIRLSLTGKNRIYFNNFAFIQ